MTVADLLPPAWAEAARLAWVVALPLGLAWYADRVTRPARPAAGRQMTD